MKKRIFSLLLALVLCLGMTEGMLAAEVTPVASMATDANGLPIPNPSWNSDGSWSITMDMVGTPDQSLTYACRTYLNGQDIGNINHSYAVTTDTTMVLNMADAISQGGDYKIVVYNFVRNADGTITKGTEVATETKTYVHPGTSLGTTVATVDKTRAGVFTFDGVVGAEKHECTLYRIVNGVVQPHGFQRTDSYHLTENNVYEVDFSNWLREEGQYFLEIRALSPDINVIANGAVGPRSEILDTTVAQENITDKVGNANGYANAAEGLNYLVTNSSTQDLQVAMQTDGNVRQQISALETNYATQNGIIVAPAEVSEEAAAYVNANEISMVGAALNAAAGNNVKLAVTKPETAIILDSMYSNTVQLDLKLWRDTTSVSDLLVPITITMPMPAGVHPTNLRLMHYHEGDTVGSQVSYALSADGRYITFTVDSFSTFVFANETPADTGSIETIISAMHQGTAQTTDALPTAPKTGDVDMTWYVVLCMSSVLGIAVVLKNRKKYID